MAKARVILLSLHQYMKMAACRSSKSKLGVEANVMGDSGSKGKSVKSQVEQWVDRLKPNLV